MVEIIRELAIAIDLKADMKALKKLEASVDSISHGLTRLAIGSAAVAGTIFGFAKATSHAAAEAKDSAEIVGVNVERFQELTFAAQKFGNVSREELVTGLRFLSLNLDKARRGSKESVDAFKRLGLASTVLANKNLKSDQVLGMVADRIAGLTDHTQKVALATQFFGRSGARLIPLLNEGSAGIARMGARARELGIVLSESAIETADRFDKSLEDLMASLKGIVYTVGVEAIKAIGPFVNQMTALVVQNRKLIATNIQEFLEAVSVFLKISFEFASLLIRAIKGLSRAFGGLNNVIKFTAIILAGIYSAKVAIGIGNMVTVVLSLARAFGIANAAALAIPLSIFAIIVALGLIAEDIYTFTQGGDSVFGLIVNAFKSLTTSFSTWVIEQVQIVTAAINSVIAQVTGLAGSARSFFGGGLDQIGSFLGISPTASPGAEASTNSNSMTVAPTINVAVPPNTPVSQIPGAIQSGISDSLAPILRSTQRNYSMGVAY